MTKHEMPTHGTNAPQPVRSLRDWLDHLAARGRLAVMKPGIGLKFDLAAHAKRLDGLRATVFPKPGGHPMPVVSGLVSDRGWMAEAMGVEPAEMLAHFQAAALHPLPWQEVKSAPAQEVVHQAGRPAQTASDTDPQRARRRALYRGRHHGGAQSEDRKTERLDPPLPGQRPQPSRRAGAAAPHLHVSSHGRGGRPAAGRCHRHRRRPADLARLAGDRADRPRRA